MNYSKQFPWDETVTSTRHLNLTQEKLTLRDQHKYKVSPKKGDSNVLIWNYTLYCSARKVFKHFQARYFWCIAEAAAPIFSDIHNTLAQNVVEILPIKIFIVSAGEQIAGIIYQPESLQGMRENLERVLQFMASKKIRMHQISSREVLEGNLKAVMRLILALAAHYKPQSVKHHDASYDNIPDVKAKPDKTDLEGKITW